MSASPFLFCFCSLGKMLPIVIGSYASRAIAAACTIIIIICQAANADGMDSDGLAQLNYLTAGSLRVVGSYSSLMKGRHIAIALPNGKVLVYGTGLDTLASAMWDPQLRGWKKIDLAPECQGMARLYTATALPGSKILFAGGLCNEPRMLDDKTPRIEYRKLSLWNGETEKWEVAPELQHGRMNHTASLLPDGMVLLAGGESDPDLPGSRDRVLASVETYLNGNIAQLPDLNTARARHTATVEASGKVLVAGGFDRHGRAIASVEIWSPETLTWSNIQPMNFARYGHSATLLDDGRIMVAGGIGEGGKPLRTVEIWDTVSGKWSAGVDLPQPLHNHATVLLNGGDVLLVGGTSKIAADPETWAWVWEKLSGQWLPAGSARPESAADLEHRLTLSRNKDGSVHVFTRRLIMQWRPFHAVPRDSVPPRWLAHAPAMAVIDGDRVMTAGRLSHGSATPFAAHIWSPTDNTWSAAGYPAHDPEALLQLPSGRVMSVSIGKTNHLLCELWQPGDDSWAPCGDLQLEKVAELVVPALLKDGRAVVITASNEAHVFDENSGQWSSGKQQWNYEGLTWGAPIWQDHPLDTLIDEEGREFDVSAAAARFWGNLGGRRNHALVFSDRPTVEVAGRASPPQLLWDSHHNRWAYVLSPGTMGKNPELLPDGCALSVWSSSRNDDSFSFFDYATGNPGVLSNPGTGIRPTYASMVVLKDGTVVVAGLPEADAGFFHRKASCAGWAPADDDWVLMPSERGKTSTAASVPVKTAQKKVKTVAPVSMKDRLLENRLLIFAVLGPLCMYVLLRFAILPFVRVGVASVFSKTTAQRLDKPVSSKSALVMRILVYGALLVFGLPILIPVIALQIRQQESWLPFRSALEECRGEECINEETGLLESIPTLAKYGAKPMLPCKYIGLWASIGKDKRTHRIALKDDGTYSMQLNDVPEGYTGYWMIQGGHLVWRHNQGLYREADINKILPHSEIRFELIEQNGWHTRFDLIEKIDSNTCSP